MGGSCSYLPTFFIHAHTGYPVFGLYMLSVLSPDVASHGRNDTGKSGYPGYNQGQDAHPRAEYDVLP
jgi:hypothetical protein